MRSSTSQIKPFKLNSYKPLLHLQTGAEISLGGKGAFDVFLIKNEPENCSVFVTLATLHFMTISDLDNVDVKIWLLGRNESAPL